LSGEPCAKANDKQTVSEIVFKNFCSDKTIFFVEKNHNNYWGFEKSHYFCSSLVYRVSFYAINIQKQ